MKILLALGWYFPESTGGTEVYVSSLAKYLKAFGYDPVVVAPIKGDKVSHYFHEGIPVFRYPIPTDPTRAEVQEIKEPRYFSEYAQLLSELKPDIVHFHTTSWTIGNCHLRAARSKGRRSVVTIHTPTQGYLCPRGTNMIWGKKVCDGIVKPIRCGACMMQTKGFHPVLGFGLSLMRGWPGSVRRRLLQQKELLSLVDKILVLSDARKEILLRNGASGEEISLCRLAVSQSTAEAIHKPLSKELVIGYVGRMDAVKGLDVLIKGFRKIHRQAPIRLKIFTASAIDGEYYEWIRSLTVGDLRIEFCAPVEPDDMPSIFRQIDVLAVPSLCMEGGPTVLLEALACKVPVIGSRVSAISEYIQHGKNGLLFEPGDIAGVEGALINLLSDERLLPSLIGGIQKIRTMEEVALEMKELYLELLEKNEKNMPCERRPAFH